MRWGFSGPAQSPITQELHDCLKEVNSPILMAGQNSWPLVAERIRAERIPDTAGLMQRATRMDFENYLAEDILVKADRASMLNSLELRAPLLDHRIIEFAFGRVPSHLKATPTSRKVLLKRLAGRLLPREFDQNRKQGFSIPLMSLKNHPQLVNIIKAFRWSSMSLSAVACSSSDRSRHWWAAKNRSLDSSVGSRIIWM